MSRARGAGPLLALAVVFAAVLLVEGLTLGGAWALREEAAVLDRARGGSLVADGEAGAAYPLLLAPAARMLSAPAAHGLARAAAALLWAAALLPAYVLARTLLPPRAALAASGLSLAGPVALYATAALPDALALLLALAALAFCLRATERRSVPLLLAAVALAGAAALARPWLAVLPPALVLAFALPRLDLRRLTRWPGSLVFAGIAVLVYAAVLVAGWAAPELGEALLDPAGLGRAALAATASAAVAVLVVPWLLATAAPVPVRRLPLTRLALVCAPALALAGGLAGTASPDRVVEERPLVVLLPLVLPLAARVWLERPSRLLLAGAAAVFVVAAAALPSVDPPATGSLGLVMAAPQGASRVTLVASALAVGVLAGAAALVLRHRPTAAAAFLGLLLVTGHALAWSGLRTQAREALPDVDPVDRVDRAAGADATVVLVGREETLASDTIAADALWNRTLRDAVAVDPAAAAAETGVLAPAPGADYLLLRGFDAVGDPVASADGATLVRREPQLRAAQTVEGLYEDGWSGEVTVLRRFGGAEAPVAVIVTASRAAWDGPDRPGEVVVATGPLDGEAEPRARALISAGRELTLEAEVPPPPFRVVVTVTPTFSPAEFGGTDTRQLGAQLSFAFRLAGRGD